MAQSRVQLSVLSIELSSVLSSVLSIHPKRHPFGAFTPAFVDGESTLGHKVIHKASFLPRIQPIVQPRTALHANFPIASNFVR